MLGVLIYEQEAEGKVYKVSGVFYNFCIFNWTLANAI
jgi:hypothetical protein